VSDAPLGAGYYDRPVVEVARDMVGCLLRFGDGLGRIVETEAYHFTEPASHAHAGLTPRTEVLHGAPGLAYVYRSYGIHALLNAVCEEDGVGAAVLIRALEPLEGLEAMARRRGRNARRELCNGPGKLTQAMGIGLDLNGTRLDGPIEVLPAPAGAEPPDVVVGERVGITHAVELPWRFCDARSDCVSSPRPPAMRRGARPLAV
jgi:DNA-3-methyladenine glycosylase